MSVLSFVNGVNFINIICAYNYVIYIYKMYIHKHPYLLAHYCGKKEILYTYTIRLQ